jgi:hypothetical protein
MMDVSGVTAGLTKIDRATEFFLTTCAFQGCGLNTDGTGPPRARICAGADRTASAVRKSRTNQRLPRVMEGACFTLTSRAAGFEDPLDYEN